jgi:DNA-binding Xre family transcriptional regulator
VGAVNKRIRSNVKRIMEEKGETIRSLAQKTGLAEQTILRARADDTFNTCRFGTIGKIAMALDVLPEELAIIVGDDGVHHKPETLIQYGRYWEINERLEGIVKKLSEGGFKEGELVPELKKIHEDLRKTTDVFETIVKKKKNGDHSKGE